MAPKKEFEVAVIGGGIAGLTLAIALYHRQIPVTLYEQAAKFGEIGAGVSFSPNAVQAMKVCHQGVYDAFNRVCTRNLWPSKQNVWFDYLNGYDNGLDGPGHQESAFSICNDLGQNGVHRAHFLDELIKLIPVEIGRFNKRLRSITQEGDVKLTLSFWDGSTASADIVVGCDGIKSRVRSIIVGAEHPSAMPSYTNKYAYRGLVPMHDAIAAIGEERAQNACMHMGPDGHILTFPVAQGSILNIVAFRTNSKPWLDTQKLTRQATRAEALRDFAGYGPNVMALLNLTKPDLDCWAIFDLADNPPPTLYKGRMCIAGDAAHATSPHHGAGAGFCIEDSAVLAELLADDMVCSVDDLQVVCATFDAERRERGNWLVQSSRWIGDCYEWRAAGIGRDFAKIEVEINTRNGIIANVDVKDMCDKARVHLRESLT